VLRHPKLAFILTEVRRSQWPRGLRRRSSAVRLLRLWFRIPPEAWIFVCCEYCVLSGRGLCDGLITRPEESYRLWRVVVCDQETSKTRSLKPALLGSENTSKMVVTPGKHTNTQLIELCLVISRRVLNYDIRTPIVVNAHEDSLESAEKLGIYVLV